MNISRPALERFESKYIPEPNSGCWLWTGYLDHDGYGQFTAYAIGRRAVQIRAHRWSYEHFRAPIPEGLQIDHCCRVRCCVNPSHLEPVTCKVNVHRGKGLAVQNIKKTHCPKGHPYDESNTLHQGKETARRCRICRRVEWTAHNQRMREASL